MVVIRLTRVGKKNSPAYRVVVAEKRRAVKRKFIEVIGHYSPIEKPKQVVISRDRALFWLKAGAQPSDTVRNLMADLEIIPKAEKANIKYGRSKKKKELKAEADAKPETATSTAENVEADKVSEAEKPEVQEAEVEAEADKVDETVEADKAEETSAEAENIEKSEDKKEENKVEESI
jgi:small subunit ribosomal protein S16